MTFIDVHCHLDICKNIPEIIKNVKKSDVKIIITNGVNIETNRKTLELSEKYPLVKAALGIYPIEALKLSDKEIDKEISFIKENKDKIIAIGEIGLDYKEDQSEHDRQKQIFKKFISLSLELDKPIIIHSRKAEEETIEILEIMHAKKVIMHCFSGNFLLVEKIAKNLWYLSIPASIKNSEHFQKMVNEIPLDRLLCETDSPFLHPDKLKNNTPDLVIESYKKIAEIKSLDLDKIKEKIYDNYKKLFL